MSVVSEPIGWLAGISSRKVDSGFACHGFVFKRFHAFPFPLWVTGLGVGMIVLEDLTMMGKSSYRT